MCGWEGVKGKGPRFLTQYIQGTNRERHVEVTIATEIPLTPAADSAGGGADHNGPPAQWE